MLIKLFGTLAGVAVFVAACMLAPIRSDGPVDPLKAWDDNPRTDPEFVILNLPQRATEAVCILSGVPAPQPSRRILGCAPLGPFEPGEACLIIMAGDLPHGYYEAVLRHEKAHCRGWKHGDPKPRGELG